MQRILLHNWKEKLVCLLLGAALWYLIHQNLVPASGRTQLSGDQPEPVLQTLLNHGAKPSKK